MMQGQNSYPVQFSVDYPEKPLDRLSTFFRLIAIIPIFIVLALVSGATWQGRGHGVPSRRSPAERWSSRRCC